MTTPKRPARRTTTRRRTTTTRGRTTTRRRRTTPRVATTVGSALGLLLVTAVTSMSWPQRLALAGAALVAGLAYVLWRHRAEIRSAAAGSADPADTAPAGAVTDPNERAQ